MSGWIYFLLFFVVSVFYFHVQQQWKRSGDLEIYEYKYSTYDDLQETCKCKQPFIFFLTHDPEIRPSELQNIHIKDTREKKQASCENDTIYLSFRSGSGLIETDKKSTFYSYRNQEEIQKDSSILKWFHSFDSFLQPSLSYSTEYDLLYGSKKAHTTTIMYHESHNFLYLPPNTNNSFVRIRMTPYKSKAFFSVNMDYVNYEFWSDYDLFDDDHPHVKSIEYLLERGQILFIPSYWFYSIEFQDKQNELCMFRYTTYPNILANAKHIFLYSIQQQNIEEKWLKPLYSDLQNENIERKYLTEESEPIESEKMDPVDQELNKTQDKKEKEESNAKDVVNNLLEQITAAK